MGCGLKLSAIVFYRTPTLDARISLTDEIVTAIMPQPAKKNGGHSHPLLVEWQKIILSIRELLPVRNSIAHNEVISVIDTTKHERPEEPFIQIVPSVGEFLRGRTKKTLRLHAPDLTNHKIGVDVLHIRVLKFRKELKELLEEHQAQSRSKRRGEQR